jgi:glycosyltransferase involved in cell wall biosynthesis
MYTAQNVDKRYPPPFFHYENGAYRCVAAFYPCSRQAASVLRGKGFAGAISVLGLGYDDTVFHPGSQSVSADEIVLALVGRLVPEKGVTDAVHTLARVHAMRPARLVVHGRGPEEVRARELAASLGVADRLDLRPWQAASELASTYRAAHVVLIPSVATETWVEQFGRVIVEAQACGAVVAGYATGTIPEVAGEAGIIVPAGDIEQLAAGVARVVADPTEFARRRDDGRRRAATRTWQALAELQVGLYRAVHANERAKITLPSSPRQRRAAARTEFGSTASTLRGARPFALPILRRGGPVAGALAALSDAMAELTAHLSP